jgi:hypothetical protein
MFHDDIEAEAWKSFLNFDQAFLVDIYGRPQVLHNDSEVVTQLLFLFFYFRNLKNEENFLEKS